MDKFTYGGRTYTIGNTYYTDYPFTELGDEPYKEAPIRQVTLLSFDGNKYCGVKFNNVIRLEVKAGYLYETPWRLTDE